MFLNTHTVTADTLFHLVQTYQKRDFFSKLPFNYGGVITLDRDYYGFGSKYTRTFNLDNKIRIYPIMSPSELQVFIYANSNNGEQLLQDTSIGRLTSPGNEFVDINVNSILEKSGIDKNIISSYGE